jgi:hypothetical protein
MERTILPVRRSGCDTRSSAARRLKRLPFDLREKSLPRSVRRSPGTDLSLLHSNIFARLTSKAHSR